MNLPLVVVYNISIISLMGPMECLLSMRWVAKLDLRILYLRSWKCSLNVVWNDRPVWPIYRI